MKLVILFLLLGAAGLAGCSTVDSRIASRRAEFAGWPAAVQAKIRAGQIDLGFTPEQVRVALGDPDRIYVRTTAAGEEEVWAYFERRGRFSFGVGVGMGAGYNNAAGGVVYAPGEHRDAFDAALRVTFQKGRVASIAQRQG